MCTYVASTGQPITTPHRYSTLRYVWQNVRVYVAYEMRPCAIHRYVMEVYRPSYSCARKGFVGIKVRVVWLPNMDTFPYYSYCGHVIVHGIGKRVRPPLNRVIYIYKSGPEPTIVPGTRRRVKGQRRMVTLTYYSGLEPMVVHGLTNTKHGRIPTQSHLQQFPCSTVAFWKWVSVEQTNMLFRGKEWSLRCNTMGSRTWLSLVCEYMPWSCGER
jgi:hypothetical protein